MGKKIFVLIVVLMSISLIGIVSVQLYWINNAIESKENQFKGDVTKALARVSERLEIKEEDLFYNKIESFIKTKRFLNKAQIKNFLIQQIDTSSKSRFSFGTTIIEEDFKIPALDILDKNGFYDNDSIVVKRFTKKRDVFKGTFVVGDNEFKDVFNVNKLFFIFIIVVAFSSSLYQLVKQKKISEIKTDFINNMTHEFKTPIATINLALDSIKNPKIINDQEKVLRYIKMIREENKRMHGQVENVLRISRLEKNQIEINTEASDMHDVIDDAISHVSLLAIDKQGSISTHFQAIQSETLVNQFHMTNVLVNILENALKYSDEKPKIDVYTESTNKNLLIKIEDQGIGMAKNVQKQIFDKFYREQKGNIHNIKGHGLGLAYVKEIVDTHHGTVFVDSEKGKGSTFTIKLPLI